MQYPRSAIRFVMLLLALLFAGNTAVGLGFKTRNYPAGIAPNSVVKGDFNNDGKLDLVIADSCQNINCDTYGVVKVLLGNGDGRFTSAKKYRSAQDGESSIFVTAGDFNGDGNLDLAVVNTGINIFGDVSVLLGHGDGSFGLPDPNEVGGSTPVWAATGDLNRDGKLESCGLGYYHRLDRNSARQRRWHVPRRGELPNRGLARGIRGGGFES